jgi:hypothetical protein
VLPLPPKALGAAGNCLAPGDPEDFEVLKALPAFDASKTPAVFASFPQESSPKLSNTSNAKSPRDKKQSEEKQDRRETDMPTNVLVTTKIMSLLYKPL